MFKSYVEMMKQNKELYESVKSNEKFEINPDNVLFVIDMQNDFVPSAKNGGRFGVFEGEDCANNIIDLLDTFSKKNANIIASRDYHPNNHCSFVEYGGIFPSHCIQGGEGSKFYKPIKDKLEKIKDNLLKTVDINKDLENKEIYDLYLKETHQKEASQDAFKLFLKNKHEKKALNKLIIVFKAFSHVIDSFGALPYSKQYGDERRLRNNEPVGCCLDWTGGYFLKCSSITEDINAPPDVLSVMKKIKIQDIPLMKNKNTNIFICGLAYDYCVYDTAINLIDNGYKNVNVVYDASRPAYIKGVGSFKGYLNDPIKILEKFKEKNIKIIETKQVN